MWFCYTKPPWDTSCGGPDDGLAQALGLLISGSGPIGHGTHHAPLFLRLEDYALLVEEKYSVLGLQERKIVD